MNKNLENEVLELKDYVKSMKLRDARTLFLIRSGMINAKMNMKSNTKYSMDLWRCDDCRSMDSQSHIIWKIFSTGPLDRFCFWVVAITIQLFVSFIQMQFLT